MRGLWAKPLIDVPKISIPPDSFYTEQELYFRQNIDGFAAMCDESVETTQPTKSAVSCVHEDNVEVRVSLKCRVFRMMSCVKLEHQAR